MSKPIPKSVLEKVDKLLTNVSVIWDFVADLKDIRHHFIPLIQEKFIQEHEFYLLGSFLRPQSYAPIFQKYLIWKLGAENVKREENRGDFLLNTTYYEYKISVYNADETLNVIQVRIWQETDYIIQYLDKKYNPPISFLLTHDDMKYELDRCKATSAHGTKTVNKDNVNIEYRFSFKKHSEVWDDWVRKYSINLSTLSKS